MFWVGGGDSVSSYLRRAAFASSIVFWISRLSLSCSVCIIRDTASADRVFACSLTEGCVRSDAHAGIVHVNPLPAIPLCNGDPAQPANVNAASNIIDFMVKLSPKWVGLSYAIEGEKSTVHEDVVAIQPIANQFLDRRHRFDPLNKSGTGHDWWAKDISIRIYNDAWQFFTIGCHLAALS